MYRISCFLARRTRFTSVDVARKLSEGKMAVLLAMFLGRNALLFGNWRIRNVYQVCARSVWMK